MAAFDDVVSIDTVDIRFEYPWEKYFMKVETSIDGNDWVMVEIIQPMEYPALLSILLLLANANLSDSRLLLHVAM